MNAYKMPKNNEEEKKLRSDSIKEATLYAAEVPLQVMSKSYECYKYILKLSKDGNQNSISDTGVACLCVHSAIYGAYLNVKINLVDVSDDRGISKKANLLIKTSKIEKEKILKYIEGKI